MRVLICEAVLLAIVVSASFIGSTLCMPRLVFKVPPEKFLLCPDVNEDGQVNTRDLAIVGESFGAIRGSGNWNPMADVNGDGIIDIFDIVPISIALSSTF